MEKQISFNASYFLHSKIKNEFLVFIHLFPLIYLGRNLNNVFKQCIQLTCANNRNIMSNFYHVIKILIFNCLLPLDIRMNLLSAIKLSYIYKKISFFLHLKFFSYDLSIKSNSFKEHVVMKKKSSSNIKSSFTKFSLQFFEFNL